MSFGIPNNEIKATLAKADLVLDQALILLRHANALIQDLQSMTLAVKVAIGRATTSTDEERVN